MVSSSTLHLASSEFVTRMIAEMLRCSLETASDFVDTFRKADTMSPMVQPTKNRRPRRQFDDEFKAGAVRLVLDEGRSVGQVARDLDLTESALRNWVERARADRTQGRTGLTTEERDELRRLRKENRRLRVERDVLKKAAAFFARESE